MNWVKSDGLKIGIFGVLAFFFCFSLISAQELSTPPASPKYKLSFTERFRIETWDNSVTLSNAANAGNSYSRNRSSITGQWFPAKPLELCLRISNEFRSYFAPANRTFNVDEFFVDQLYLKWKDPVGLPASLTIGRQNMQLGEGFIIMDGGPLDGSRSGYFNAFRADYEFWPKKNLTLFYSVQHRTDDFLPVVNDKDKALSDQTEKAGGLYFSGDFGPHTVQAYYIRKDGESSGARPLSCNVNVVGERTTSMIVSNLMLTAEWAYQFGKIGDADLSAIGGYSYLTWHTGLPKLHPASLTAGTIYLGGDNADTDKYEGWDPIYGRWPKWSDSYIYTLSKEGGVAYWSNLFSLYGKAQVDIARSVKFTFDYHHLMAPQKAPSGQTFPGGNGKHRGELRIARLTYQLHPAVSGHLIWENFNPGSFYFADADPANWMRIEFMLNL